MIKTFINKIPQLSLLVIIISLIKTLLYYSNFDIPIKYFLGLSELGLLIADDLLILVPIYVIFYIVYFKFDSVGKEGLSTNNKTKIEKEVSTKPKFSTLRRFFSKSFEYLSYAILILVAGFMVIMPIYLFFTTTSYPLKLLASALIIVIGYFILFAVKHEELQKFLTDEGMSISLLLMLFIMSFVFRISNEISEVENGRYTGTRIVTKDSTYISDSNSFYVGQTSKYVFIFSKKDSLSTILPVEKIDKIIFKTNVVKSHFLDNPK
jgi:hypothetical protein